jgi:alcohol dehydrogenase class IV
MKTLIKLLIAALVVNACYRVGVAYWEYYEFEDAIEKTIQFSRQATPDDLTKAILELAEERGIPIEESSLAVTRTERQVVVDAAYERSVEVAPRMRRTFRFAPHVSVLMVN